MSAIKPLKIIFAGTPEFAVVALQALLNSLHTIEAVYTQPDRPSGRGRQLTASPVKQLALQQHLSVEQPLTLRDAETQKKLADWQADVMVVAAYGLLLPAEVLKIPRLGCINIHPSLLPRWRGAAPIQRTIFAGDKQTGVTIMQMEAGLDSGPMLSQVTCDVAPDATSASLHDALAIVGAQELLRVLDDLVQGKADVTPQNEKSVTYAQKITKAEAHIDWKTSAVEIAQKVRAFNPWPVAQTLAGKEVLRIWQAQVIDTTISNKTPGIILQISPQGIDVATAAGILRLQQLQLPGKRVMSAAELLNAYQADFNPGTILI